MQANEQALYVHDLKQRLEALESINSQQADVLADLQRQSRSQPCECTCTRDTPAALDAQQLRIQELKAVCEAKGNLFIDGLVTMSRQENEFKEAQANLDREYNMEIEKKKTPYELERTQLYYMLL